MRLASFLALLVALIVPSARIAAQEPGINPSFSAPKAVLELFTSQGCDTCPPADAVLASYAERPDIIALSLPVDIWDYLGWKDTLASEKNSERQKAYARSRGDGAIYTPQVVVNGMMGVNGSDFERDQRGDQGDGPEAAAHARAGSLLARAQRHRHRGG